MYLWMYLFIIKTESCAYGGWQVQNLQSPCPSWSLKNGSFSWNQKEQMSPFEGRSENSHLFVEIWVLFYAGLQLITGGSSTLCRAICCTQSASLNVNPIPNTLTEKSRIMFAQISKYLMAQSTWHIKWIITSSPRVNLSSIYFCLSHI